MATRQSSASPALVRFSNVTEGQGVVLLWIDHHGQEQVYSNVCPGQVYTQQTYVNHMWVIRLHPQGDSVGRVVASESSSTVSIYKNQNDRYALEVIRNTLVPLHHIHSCLPSPHDMEWGQYTCRGSTQHGIPICSHIHAVEYSAVEKAVFIIDKMLESVPRDCRLMIDAMLSLGLEIAIIGRDQKTTDIPAHAHLRGEYISHGMRKKRSFEHDTRGLGATVSCPVLSCGEDNLLELPGKDRYPYESILVHEFAHAVMNLGLYTKYRDLYSGIKDAYDAAQRNHMYDAESYVMTNPEEYWAEMTQAWFHATKRNDVTSGIKTRDQLIHHDPRLAAIMARVYGNGSWSYYSSSHQMTETPQRCTCICM